MAENWVIKWIGLRSRTPANLPRPLRLTPWYPELFKRDEVKFVPGKSSGNKCGQQRRVP